MAPQFNPPSWQKPDEHQYIGQAVGSIDKIFNAYQQAKIKGMDLGATLAGQGVDPVQGGSDPHSVYGQLISRHQEGRKQKSAESAAGIRKDEAQAGLYEAQANLYSGMGGAGEGPQVITDPKTGLQFMMKMGARGPEYHPVPQPNQNEFVARGFSDAATKGHQDFEALMGTGFDPAAFKNAAQSIPFLPNRLKSDDVKKYEQAKAMFINASLRRESGATIRDDEYYRAEKQYFPQDGDDKATSAQKSEARRIKIASLESEGRRVPSALGPAAKSPAPAAGKVRVSNGKETLLIDPADESEAAKDGFKRL